MTGPPVRLLCATLRTASAAWPQCADETDLGRQVLRAAEYHGVSALVHRRIRSAAGCQEWPAALRDALASRAGRQEALELLRKSELARVLISMVVSGLQPLLIKGAALAYTHYDSPGLRPRCDTDVLVEVAEVGAVGKLLAALGYEPAHSVSGDLASYQTTYSKQGQYGVQHALDVHWKINNSQLLANVLTHGEAVEKAVAVPDLCEHARGLCPVHALLLACIHRASHEHAPYYVNGVAHYGGDRLIWLYDIHLLVSRMSAQELDEFAALAAAKRVRAVCAAGLWRAAECFGTALPGGFLAAPSQGSEKEPSAVYLRAGPLRAAVEELRSLADWSSRGRYLKEHLFPSADYMLRKYGRSSRVWLPLLYADRGLRGIAKRLRRH